VALRPGHPRDIAKIEDMMNLAVRVIDQMSPY
jgi:hypothetical protein